MSSYWAIQLHEDDTWKARQAGGLRHGPDA